MAPGRPHRCGIEVVGAEEVMPSGHGGLWTWSKQVEGEFGLGQQEVPTIPWESWGSACGQEMIFECMYGPFGTVALMHMRWH